MSGISPAAHRVRLLRVLQSLLGQFKVSIDSEGCGLPLTPASKREGSY
jgi:hypothetical protein